MSYYDVEKFENVGKKTSWKYNPGNTFLPFFWELLYTYVNIHTCYMFFQREWSKQQRYWDRGVLTQSEKKVECGSDFSPSGIGYISYRSWWDSCDSTVTLGDPGPKKYRKKSSWVLKKSPCWLCFTTYQKMGILHPWPSWGILEINQQELLSFQLAPAFAIHHR